jgi:hypothetical protein
MASGTARFLSLLQCMLMGTFNFNLSACTSLRGTKQSQTIQGGLASRLCQSGIASSFLLNDAQV